MDLRRYVDRAPTDRTLDDLTLAFAETPSRYLLEIAPGHLDAAIRALREADVPFAQIGSFVPEKSLSVRTGRQGRVLSLPLATLRETWIKPLDW